MEILPRLRGTRQSLFSVLRGTFDTTALTAARTYTLPDASGALTVGTFDTHSDYARPTDAVASATTFSTNDTRKLWYLFNGGYTVSVPNPNSVPGQAIAFEVDPAATGVVTVNALSWQINGQQFRHLAPGDAVILRAFGNAWRREPGTLRPLSCRRYLTSALVVNTDTRLPMGTTDYDSHGLMSGSGAAAGGILIPRPGLYDLNVKVQVRGASGGVPSDLTLNAYVQKNQTTVSISTGVVAFVNLGIPAGQYSSAVHSQTVLLAAGDYLHLGATAGPAVTCDPGVLGTSLEVTELPGW